MQKEKNQMYDFVWELLSCRSPFPSYSFFLFEQSTLFKLISIKEGRPYQFIISYQFLYGFTQSDFSKQKLLCELYLHKLACLMDHSYNHVPYIGDIHLRDFSSFVTNHMRWWHASQTIRRNEDNSMPWIRGEPHYPEAIFAR